MSEPQSGAGGRGGLQKLFGSFSSVRGKLTGVVLLTTTIALLIAGIAMLRHDLGVYRQAWAADLTTEASILALSTAPALAFDDHDAAVRNLAALRAKPSVLAAAVYTADGNLYASYARAAQPDPPPRLPTTSTGARISGERVEVSERLVQNGEMLGTIYLRARYDVVGRITAYLQIFALVMLFSLGVALALSAALRRVITGPLDAMADVAKQVVSQRDYSLRAKESALDEAGLVVAAFNSMLDEVQARTRALEQSNTALKSEIEVRRAIDQALRKSENLYRAIGESIDYGVWVCDASGRNIYASESFLRLAGITQQQCSDFGWGDALHPDDAPATIQAWQDCVQTGGNWYREHRFRGVDGRYHAILAQGVPTRDENGRITGWAGINLDINRLKRTEEALRDADRRKDEFLATLAHELRNPLAPIRHATKLLAAKGLDEGRQQWAREIIARQVERMALLLDDLLEVSRITRGRVELRKEPVALTALVKSAVETARPLLDARQHTFEVHLPAEGLELDVDPLRISQALSNLLTNAAKYTDHGGRITLDAVLEPDHLAISVSDNGIGLSAAALPTIFEMFSQVDSAIERSEGGLGIGLALVKGLVTLHGGTVDASSAGLGQGSRFTIQLPRVCVLDRREAAGLAATAATATSAARCKVLVVDDNRDAADSLAMLLQCSGYITHVAHSGQEALRLGGLEQPQAIILDIGMPDMTGYEAAMRIRRESWGRGALLVAVTGWGQRDDIARAMEAGFDHHLTKPADPEHVEGLLGDFLRKATTV